MKILIIVAHPDDEVLGCGGILSKYKDYEKILITMTDGESSRNNYEKNYNRNILLSEICKLYNINKYYCGSFPDNKMDIIPLIEIVKFIESNTNNFEPDLIFTHHPNCLNIDHSLTFRAVLTAFRPQNGIKCKILSFYIPSSTDYNPLNNFRGNIYIKLIEEDIQNKIRGLEIYKNEIRNYPHSRSIENIINLCKTWGNEVGTEYCEKFELIREII